MSLLKQILKYRNEGKRELFTTPSHSQENIPDSISKNLLGKKVYECDYSEIDGFDNLRNPESVLKNLLEKLSAIYKSKASFILTNGSSSGIIASMITLLKENDKVLVARNCHVSVYNGLVLTGARPIWIKPNYNKDWGIFEGLTPEAVQTAIEKNPDAKALILTSPTYEGLFSDIKSISSLVKKAGMFLIVDEAHGALLNFGAFSHEPAILCGADISVQSLHKNAGAITPGALLHIGSNSQINPEKIQESLNIINTTSPSYPLMLSVENTVNFLYSKKGKKYIKNLQRNIKKHTEYLTKNSKLKIYSGDNDPTKILVKIKKLSGLSASEILNSKYKIEEEYSNTKSILFLTGIGTSGFKLFKLFYALSKLANEPEKEENDIYINYDLPEQVMSPKDAFHKESRLAIIGNTLNKIAAEPVLTYPPGIPVIIPGELIDERALQYIDKNSVKVLAD